jgi:hypothetical protein
VIGQKRYKPNRIEYVGLPDSIRTRDAVKRAEIDGEIDQILESVYFKAR